MLPEQDQLDKEATFFAMHLLMPSEFLAKDLEEMQIDIDDTNSIRELAKKYRVTPGVMLTRIGMLQNESGVL